MPPIGQRREPGDKINRPGRQNPLNQEGARINTISERLQGLHPDEIRSPNAKRSRTFDDGSRGGGQWRNTGQGGNAGSYVGGGGDEGDGEPDIEMGSDDGSDRVRSLFSTKGTGSNGNPNIGNDDINNPFPNHQGKLLHIDVEFKQTELDNTLTEGQVLCFPAQQFPGYLWDSQNRERMRMLLDYDKEGTKPKKIGKFSH